MITCNEYDYIEIACLYRFPVRLTMKTGESIEGVVFDTTRNESRNECIKLHVGSTEATVELESISKLNVLIDNPHFSEVVFT